MRLPALSRILRGCHARVARQSIPPAVLAAATAAALLVAAPAGPAVAATAGTAAHASRTTANPQAQAENQARRTGKAVVIPGSTTPTSQIQALPDGRFAMTTSAQPVRAWASGAWRPLNATLRPSANGTWSPEVSTAPVSISGGGTGALATMSSGGRDLSLYWPGTLPRPAVSGDTAVYPSVLAGVDLRITVSAEGGVSDVLVIHNRTAAANPSLRSLALTAVTTGGLRLASSPSGTLAAATQGGSPAFTAPPALMWDSATATSPASPQASPATSPASRGLAAVRLVAPANSSAERPGRHAHAAWVRTVVDAPRAVRAGVTSQAVSLIPDATMLTSPATVFPAFVDPTWLNSGGSRGWYASTNTLNKDTNEYDNTADPQGYLQVGDSGSFNAHAFVQMVLHPNDLLNATISSAVIQFTQENGGSCTSSPVELWQVGNIPTVSGKPFASWDDEPSPEPWNGTGSVGDGAITEISTQYAYPSGSCAGAATLNFDISNFMKDKGPAGPSSINFELKATDTTDVNGWREFSNAAGAITMTTYYDHAPGPQKNSGISPGGACQSSSVTKTIVGNDDFALSTTPQDGDGGSVTVHFVLSNYGSATPLFNTPETATAGQSKSLQISRATIQGWHSNGATTAYTYSWYTYTIDGQGLSNQADTGIGSPAEPCLFTYDPTAPQAPGVVPVTTTDSNGNIGTIGGTATFEFENCTTALDSTPPACTGNAPAWYTYQVNDGPVKTIAVTGITQNVTIPLTRFDSNSLSVTALSSGGNPSSTKTVFFTVAAPATPYADGDYAGTGHPSLFTVGDGTGSTAKPGLWMAQSDGAGNLSTPVDIGVNGNGLSTQGTPADWAGAEVLHGDFTSTNKLQDIVAYWPSCTSPHYGTLQMVSGPGTAAPLSPESGSTGSQAGIGAFDCSEVGNTMPPSGAANPLDDPTFDWTGTDSPTDLVAAGNASLRNTGWPDLTGILGDSTNGYELVMYTATPQALDFSNAYAGVQTISTTVSPDSDPWGPNWSLAVAQPGGQAVLFALDRTNGELFESANPSQSSSSVIGISGTWQQVTGGPWTANSGPALVQADVNTAGNIELWTTSAVGGGETATSWTIAPPSSTTWDTTLTKGPVSTLATLGHEWPLTDGTPGSASLIDTETDSGNATPSTGIHYTGDGSSDDVDPFIGSVVELAGSAKTSLTLPAGMLQDSTSSHAALQSMTLTMRFLAAPGAMGILAGTSAGTLSASTLSSQSAPVIYIGTDGHLYAEFPSAHVGSGVFAPDITPMESAAPVDDGMWHTVTLVADGTRHEQVLYLDNNVPIYSWDDGYVDSTDPSTIINPGQTAAGQAYSQDQVTIGAGIFSPDGWVNADATQGSRGTTRASYFTGQISDVAFYPSTLAPAQLPHNAPIGVNTVINSGVLSSQCIELGSGGQNNGTPIQIDTCTGGGNQHWVIQPTGAIMYAPNNAYCLTATSNGTANLTPIELYTCNGSSGQSWQVLPNGSIENTHSGKCLDDAGSTTTVGTQLQLYTCNGTTAQTWSTSVRPAEITPVGTIVSVQTGFCLDNLNGSTASPNKAQVTTCTGSDSQQWTFQPDGTITVDGLCLNNTGGNTNNGNTVNAMTCNGTGAQQWAHPDTGAIENPSTGMCVQGSSTAGVGLQLWACDDDPDQTWIYPSTYNH